MLPTYVPDPNKADGASPERIAPGVQVFKTVADSAVPERIVSVAGSYVFQRALFQGFSTPVIANSGSISVGVLSGASTQPMQIISSGEREFVSPPGKLMDLYNFYVAVSVNNDGVGITYW